MVALGSGFLKLLYLSLGWTIHDRRFVRAAATRHQVTVATITAKPASDRAAGEVEMLVLPGRPRQRSFCESDSELLPALDRVMKHVSPDVVHAGPLTSAGWLAATVGGAPLVASSWGFDLLEEAQTHQAARDRLQFVLTRAAKVHVDCATVAAVARDQMGLDDRKLVIFPFGIELDRFGHVGPALDMPPKFRRSVEVVVISVRAWERHYDIETTLRAFEIAHRAHPRLGLILAGGGSGESWIREFIQATGLADAVWLVGPLAESHLASAYRSADIYMSSTPSDGTSISLLEALATGLPAVVTDNGSNREWVDAGRTGLLAPSGDAAAFAASLIEVAKWPRVKQETCRSLNRETVEKRADWRQHTDTLLQMYDAAAAHGAS